MKGKVTKDILMRVGQGVMRIPRDQDDPTLNKPNRISKKHDAKNSEKKHVSTCKVNHS